MKNPFKIISNKLIAYKEKRNKAKEEELEKERLRKEEEARHKRAKTLGLIVGGLIGLGLLGAIIYLNLYESDLMLRYSITFLGICWIVIAVAVIISVIVSLIIKEMVAELVAWIFFSIVTLGLLPIFIWVVLEMLKAIFGFIISCFLMTNSKKML